MMTRDFDFELPDELIAQEPPAKRGDSRLLVLHRNSGQVEHTIFSRLADFLRSGDLLVLNNTKVFPARLLGYRFPSGGTVECLLTRQLPSSPLGASNVATAIGDEATGRALGARKLGVEGVEACGAENSVLWEALMHTGQKLKPGARVVFEGVGVRLHGEILARHFQDGRTLRLWADGGVDVVHAIDRIGHVPLPPYIRREDRSSDRDRYQTIYARECGSIAAPTAGLHFTESVLDSLASRGVERSELTLHIGYGTFKPICSEQVEDHVVDPETCLVPADAAVALTRARREGRRVIAVGTTTMRALESLTVQRDGRIKPSTTDAKLFIQPSHEFRIGDGLITNFHLPRSSLLVLVAAFAGRERILHAYREAVTRGYRFYSYGDAMAIL